MKSRDAIELVLAALGAILAVQLSRQFIENGISSSSALAYAAAVSAVTLTALRYLLFELPLRFSFTRKLLDERAEFEGLYCEIFSTKPGNSVSIGCIEYMKSSKDYHYYGSNFSALEEGKVLSGWDSESLFISTDRRVVEYFFKTNQYKTDNRSDILGYGVLMLNQGTG